MEHLSKHLPDIDSVAARAAQQQQQQHNTIEKEDRETTFTMCISLTHILRSCQVQCFGIRCKTLLSFFERYEIPLLFQVMSFHFIVSES